MIILSKKRGLKQDIETERKVSGYRDLSARRSKNDQNQKQVFRKVE